MARKYKRLRYEDRQVIEKMSRAGSRVVDIATTLGVHRDTIESEDMVQTAYEFTIYEKVRKKG